MAARHDLRVLVHPFLDGRDTSPTGGKSYLLDLQQELSQTGVGRISTVMGRYFAMDRDHRWDRVKKAYDALTLGEGQRAGDCRAALQASYKSGVTDEFVEPIVATGRDGEPVGTVREGDAIIFFNFRADRARQLMTALTSPPGDFSGFERAVTPQVEFVCMTQYDERFDLPVAFPPRQMKNILAEVASNAGCTSFRIAETEKYAHVTYFFNGGSEQPWPGEDRLLIPSAKVATYDMKPDMSALDVTDALVKTLRGRDHDYVVCNFANPDMVGHTGVLQAAVKAVETVDTCVGRTLEALDTSKDAVIVTADHGNAEQMFDERTGGPHTAHTTNPVPCILVDDLYKGRLIRGGTLREIAPTICNYLQVEVPREMTGKDLRAQL
jgi:2,3-bisphosphoglycerate-independent phosphoglycerate mutase